MIAVFTLVADPFVQPGCKFTVDATLSLTNPLDALLQLSWVVDLLSVGDADQVLVARVDSNAVIGCSWDSCWLCIYEQAEIPAGSPFDYPATLDLSFRKILLVVANHPKARQLDLVIRRSTYRIRERDAVQAVSVALQSWSFSDLLEAALPCCICQ